MGIEPENHRDQLCTQHHCAGLLINLDSCSIFSLPILTRFCRIATLLLFPLVYLTVVCAILWNYKSRLHLFSSLTHVLFRFSAYDRARCVKIYTFRCTQYFFIDMRLLLKNEVHFEQNRLFRSNYSRSMSRRQKFHFQKAFNCWLPKTFRQV